jgi:hypothetical protein
MEYDVFICHASEDKEDFVRPLAKLLEQQHLAVWYDEFSLKVGDSLSSKIDEGLSKSKFGIVVLSKNFFTKPWTQRELRGLVTREMVEQRDVILPIWHRVTLQEVASFSLPLADKRAILSDRGINAVLRELTEKISPDQSPLVVANEYLDQLGFNPPSISDEWWLDMVEYKEFLKYPDLNASQQWIFPLPYPNDDRGFERGMNIASTALQVDWSFEGQELGIGPTSHPEAVHSYLKRWPGLLEHALKNPSILAIYVPQITIPGFDAGFEKAFDDLLQQNPEDASVFFSYGPLNTEDGSLPLCADIIALRHPTFGNFSEEELAYRYFNGHDTKYYRFEGSTFDGLTWLLSEDSRWLPEKLHRVLINGTKQRDIWIQQLKANGNTFHDAIVYADENEFSFTDEVRQGLLQLINQSVENLPLQDEPERILQRFLDEKIIESYFTYLQNHEIRRKKMRSKLGISNDEKKA